MLGFVRTTLAVTAIVLSAAGAGGGQTPDPRSVVDELLAADRAFSAASALTDVTNGLPAMFADDVVMMAPPAAFEGKAKAAEALRAGAASAGSRAEWFPIRGGISADGRHGFTFGFMTVHGPDSKKTPMKYLSYWVKGPAGWRVAAYKRTRAAEGSPPTAAMPPALPAALVAPVTDAAAIAAFKSSLEDAERAFSRDAQTIGLAAAFARYGSADAINLGGPGEPGFVVGPEAIGRAVGAGSPTNSSPLHWGPDRSIVASSGDLGVTIGTIRRNGPPEPGRPDTFPFFTIWRRASTTDPWRYVAE